MQHGEEAKSPPELGQLHALAELGVRKVCGAAGWSDGRLRALREKLSPTLEREAGAFVTLTLEGRLRGCIGYMVATRPLHEAVFENGFNAASRDPRFPPVTLEELERLEIEVSVLSPLSPIPSAADFTPGREGILLRKGGCSALFLPKVATEQGWNREETLDHLAQKAGLAPDEWREGATFETFTCETCRAPVGRFLPVVAGD